MSKEDQQKLLDEFMMVTEADNRTAQNYLEKHSWKVVEAINDYFEWMHQEYSSREAEEEEDNKKQSDDECQKDHKSNSPVAKKTKSEHPRLFRHVTYNIDSLYEKNLQLRIQAICKILIEEKATLVFLQEVRQESENIIRQKLSDQFEMFSGLVHTADYYTMTLVAKKPWINISNSQIIDFKYTAMGRNILRTDITIEDAKICLLNTHLESTKESEAIRKQQLASLLRLFDSIDKRNITIIAAGDFNIRDKELDAIGGLPSDVQDAWIATGCRKEVQYTWDMMRNDNIQSHQLGLQSNFKPRMRFDRVLLRRSVPIRIDLVHFGLVGLQRLKPHVCFPSDHWGVITSYQVYHTS